MQKNWNYTRCTEEGECTGSFKEMMEFIKSNFHGTIKVYDITNNSVKIIGDCIFEDKGSYAIFYAVDEGRMIIFSSIFLNEFFVYSYGIDENKVAYISFLDIINNKDGMIKFVNIDEK